MKKYSPYLFLIGMALEEESRNCAHKYNKLEDKIILTQKMNIKQVTVKSIFLFLECCFTTGNREERITKLSYIGI